jgi:sugar transferase (PEP-CTERM/EpsH1 system associated)
VAPRFPLPANKGDKLRVYHQLRLLSRRHSVSLLALSDEPVAAEDVREIAGFCERLELVPLRRAASLARLALRAPFERAPLQNIFYRSPRYARRLDAWLADGHFDILHGNNVRILPYLWDRPPARIVVDLTDAQTLNLRSRRALTAYPQRFVYDLELARMERYEREVAAHFRTILVSAEADRAQLGAEHTVVLPNGVDAEFFLYAEAGREPATVVMTGNMGYEPNVDGALWFARHVWPAVRAARSDVRWEIVGARPAPVVRALSRLDGVTVTGAVDDVGAYLRRATLAIAPIRSGSGIQNKVLEGLASGTPLVVTRLANRAIGALDGVHLIEADEPEETSAAILRLLGDAEARSDLARAGATFVRERFTWEAHVAALERIYERLLGA